MKKLTFIAFLCLTAVSGSAQLRMDSNGNISFKTTAIPSSPLSIGHAGSSDYFVSGKFTNTNGINLNLSGEYSSNTAYGGYLTMRDFTRSSYHVGMRISLQGTTSDTFASRSAGVISKGAHGNQSFGVIGLIADCPRGAGIYGSSYSDYGHLPDEHLYAGYFRGDTKITANLTVGGVIQGTLLSETSSGSNVISNTIKPLSSARSQSISDKMSMLAASCYQKEKSNETIFDQQDDIDDELAEDSDGVKEKPLVKESLLEKQYYAKKHFSLSAEQLETVFPDLVYENEDGSKVINYIEMIPLLVQTINELNHRLSILDGKNETAKARSINGSIEDDEETSNLTDVTAIPAGATLAQNTPNPFTERTTIRFTLPEDTKNASICIFDMSGKMLKQVPVDASMQSITIEGYELQAGMYIYSLLIDGKEVKTRRMILSK